MSIYENPKYYSGDVPQQIIARAKDGQTWQAGQFGRRTGSGVVVCKTQATAVNCQFLSTQATATSSSDVPIAMVSPNTQYIIYASTAGSDAVANKSYIGKNLALSVNSCICSATLTGQTDAKAALNIKDVYSAKDKIKTDTGASPGAFIASVRSSFITALSN